VKKWYQSKKVWGTLLGALCLGFGEKWGIDPEASSRMAWALFGGVSVEGIIDAAHSFASAWKGQ